MHLWNSLVILSCTLVAFAAAEKCFNGKLDLVLVVDVSGSLENRFTANRDAAWEVARSVPISWDKASIAVVQFSKMAITKLEFGSSETWEIVNDTIMNLEWTGDVAVTADAMDLAMIQFRRARQDSQRVIILFSDGNSFNTWEQVSATAERLHYSNSKIYAVAMNGNTYDVELKLYVEFSNGSIIKRQSDFEQLKHDLEAMTVPRCPPPSATPPQDFLRPAESNPEGENGDQLPTRRTPGPDGEHSENPLPTRTTASRRTTRRSTASRTTRSRGATSPIPHTAPAGAVVVDAGINKRN